MVEKIVYGLQGASKMPVAQAEFGPEVEARNCPDESNSVNAALEPITPQPGTQLLAVEIICNGYGFIWYERRQDACQPFAIPLTDTPSVCK